MEKPFVLSFLDAGVRVWEPQILAWMFSASAGYNTAMAKQQPRYTPEHAKSGLDANFPEIETWPNQFPGYEIVIDDPEFTSVCPRTGLPDFGDITVRYMPDQLCLELKSLKEYLQSYRDLGIFQENIVNRVLEDVVRWAKPVWAEVKGEFRPRGGISTVVLARWPRPKEEKRGKGNR
jgi:7-cyano-7-deazaguanine reductase